VLRVALVTKQGSKISGGVGRYVFELINALSNLKQLDISIYSLMPRFRDSIAPKRLLIRTLKAFTLRDLLDKKEHYDIIHIPDLSAGETPPLFLKKFLQKTIITLHGVTPLVFPSNYILTGKYGEFIYAKFHHLRWKTIFKNEKIGAIVTVSNSSRQEIVECLKIPSNRIRVVYSGINLKIFRKIKNEETLNELNKRFGINAPFILNANSYQPVKNIEKTIISYYVLKKKYEPQLKRRVPKLVLAGDQPSHIKRLIYELKLHNDVIFTGFVDTKTLVKLYSTATMLISTSLHEAFSLVPLEALATECPVVVSRIPAFMEVLKDAAIYFNPHDSFDIAEKVYMVISDESLRKNLINKGKTLIKRYSWEDTAKKYYNIYKSIAK